MSDVLATGRRPRNVLLLGIDSLGFASVSDPACWSMMPNVRRLATQGILCTNAFAHAKGTQFAFPAIISSTLPLDFGGYDEGVRNRPRTLAEALRDRGFQTTAWASVLFHGRYFGYDRGHDVFHQVFHPGFFLHAFFKHYVDFYEKRASIEGSAGVAAILRPLLRRALASALQIHHEPYVSRGRGPNALGRRAAAAAEPLIAEEITRLDRDGYDTPRVARLRAALERVGYIRGNELVTAWFRPWRRTVSAGFLADRLIESIRGAGSRPFLLWTHFLDGHDGNYSDGRFQRPPFWTAAGRRAPDRSNFSFKAVVFQNAVAYVDRQIGRVLDELSRQSRLDDTLVVIFGDHGHVDYGLERPPKSSIEFYEELVHVPMIFWNPSIQPATVSDLCGHVDLAPTVLDLLGLPAEPGFQGRSVLAGPARDVVFIEHMGRGPCDFARKPIQLAVRSARHKLVWKEYSEDGGEQIVVYDLERDPLERHDVAGDPAYAAVAAELLRHARRRRDEIRYGAAHDVDAPVEQVQ